MKASSHFFIIGLLWLIIAKLTSAEGSRVLSTIEFLLSIANGVAGLVTLYKERKSA